MVCATVALSIVITNTPRKLNTAAMKIAARGPMERVEMQVAIAFGASVHPLTRITPNVSTTVTISAGLDVSRDIKSENGIVMVLLSLQSGIFLLRTSRIIHLHFYTHLIL